MSLAAEDFNLADVRTLILYAKAMAPASEPDGTGFGRDKDWQRWRDNYTEALAYVGSLA